MVKVPAGHERQVAEPALGANLPETQSVHTAPASLVCPAGQAVQLEAAAAEERPAAHSWQSAAPSALARPARQSKHSLPPTKLL